MCLWAECFSMCEHMCHLLHVCASCVSMSTCVLSVFHVSTCAMCEHEPCVLSTCACVWTWAPCAECVCLFGCEHPCAEWGQVLDLPWASGVPGNGLTRLFPPLPDHILRPSAEPCWLPGACGLWVGRPSLLSHFGLFICFPS